MRERFSRKIQQWNSGRTWQIAWRVLQVLLVPLLFYILYQQIWTRLDWDIWRNNFQTSWASGAWVYLLFVLLLMPLNWLLETQKWRILLLPNIRLSFGVALQAVLRGVTVSLFTPNRTGEYGGRMLTAKKGEHWGFVKSTLLGSLAQWSILLACGWPALLWVGADYIEWPLAGMATALLLGWGLCGLLLALYFFPERGLSFIPGMEKLKTYIIGISWVQKWLILKEPQQVSSKKVLYWRLQAFLLAGLRYFVYSLQFLLLLYFFGYDINPILGLAGISAIFLLQAGIPLPPGIGLLLRTELALLIWPIANPAAVVAATLALFIINLAVTALLGLVFIVKIKDVNS